MERLSWVILDQGWWSCSENVGQHCSNLNEGLNGAGNPSPRWLIVVRGRGLQILTRGYLQRTIFVSSWQQLVSPSPSDLREQAKSHKPFNDLKVPAHILPYVSSFSRKIFPTSLSIHTLIYNNCFSFLLTETIFQNLSKCHDELFPGFDLFLLFIPMFVFCLFFSCLFMGLFCRWRDVEPVIWVRGPNSHLSIAIYIVILSNIFEP